MHPKFSGIPLILSVNKLWFFKKVRCMFSMRHYSSLLDFRVYLGRYLAYQFYYSKVCFPWNLVCSPDQQCKCKFATWMMFILFIASWLCRRFAIEITYTVISWANLWPNWISLVKSIIPFWWVFSTLDGFLRFCMNKFLIWWIREMLMITK